MHCSDKTKDRTKIRIKIQHLALVLGLGFLPVVAHCQTTTIGDYSRAQRLVLEAEMAKNHRQALAAKPGGGSDGQARMPASLAPGEGSNSSLPSLGEPGGAAAGLPALEGVPSSAGATPARSLKRQAGAAGVGAQQTTVQAKGLSVDGVFIARSRVLAQVSVNGVVHMLTQGQDVPGTSWQVQTIASHQVVLGKKMGKGSKVFALPSS
jgi:hypothetical protein